MTERFDAVVVGAGPAGEVCAADLADHGMEVAIVEQELLGGEAANWAGIPSKALLRPTEAVHAAKRAPGVREAGIDVGEVLAWRDELVAGWDDSSQVGALEDKGIALMRGAARINGAGHVVVDGRQLETDRIVIATGSQPVIPPIPGMDQVDVWTTRDATSVRDIPERLIVLGGGPVGVELAQAFSRLGSSVAIVEGEDRLLPAEGRHASAAIARVLSDEGIELRLGEFAEAVGKSGDDVWVRFADGTRLTGDRLLVATGRRPCTDSLGAETVGLEPERTGIEVDRRMRATDDVWAIGDVTGISLFTHVAKYQARVAAADMLGYDAAADYRAVPRVIYTDPQIARDGHTERATEVAGLHFEAKTVELTGSAPTSTTLRSPEARPGSLTLVADVNREVLVGAYAVGPEAGEWLQQATLAIRAEVPIHVLRDTIQPFPSFSEAFLDALRALERPVRR
jgi:pyruvate/2-oxoglutarate dehydrogenase complex dihydrolipoamide dehydrogenase (E3) component